MRSFGKIPTRISDPRSLGPWSIEGTDESFPRVDLSIPLMCCDPSDLGSLVLTRIIPMERTFSSNSIGKSWGVFQMRISDPSDHLDHGRSNEPMNPCPEWIHQYSSVHLIYHDPSDL